MNYWVCSDWTHHDFWKQQTDKIMVSSPQKQIFVASINHGELNSPLIQAHTDSLCKCNHVSFLLIHSLEAKHFFYRFPLCPPLLWPSFLTASYFYLQKIAKLLHQIAQMNEILIDRHKALVAKAAAAEWFPKACEYGSSHSQGTVVGASPCCLHQWSLMLLLSSFYFWNTTAYVCIL